jgi:hypothetical protein
MSKKLCCRLTFCFAFLFALPTAGRSIAQVAENANQNTVASPDVPRAIGRISDRFVNHIVERTVDQWQIVQEFLFGTSTSGSAHTQGTVTAELIPSSQQAVLDICLSGTTICDNNVGQRGSIVIRTAAGADVQARKRLAIDYSGIKTFPAIAGSSAQVQVTDIEARNRIVERLAWRRADRMHDEIEAAAAQSVSSRTERQLDEELTAAVVEADKLIHDQVRESLAHRDEFPCRLAFSSTAKYLQLALVPKVESTNLSTSLLMNPRHDVAFGIHESCLNRLFEFSIGGKKLDDICFLDMIHVLTGNSPRQLWVHDRAERWSVIPSRRSPVTAVCANDRFTVTIRFEQVIRGNQQFNRPLEITCRYASEITADGPHLIREGDLSVRFCDQSPTTEKDEELRQFVYRKFSGVFQPELYFDGLVPPAGGSLGKLRQLQLKELTFRDGWAVIGYQLPPKDAQVASAEE